MVITASEARSQLFPLIEQVNNDSTPVVITSKKGNAVLISESEWESIIETMHLLRTPANREHLAKSRAEVLAGDVYEYSLPILSVSQGKKVRSSAKTTVPAKKAPGAKKKSTTKKVLKKVKAKTST